jgi:hypothetical protein
VATSQYFRFMGIPVIFSAVSRDGDHGYVFVQAKHGACIGCLFPDMADDDRYPCPGTPAVADVLQVAGGLAIYAADTLLMNRNRDWNYRDTSLAKASRDRAGMVVFRTACSICKRSQ